MAEKGSCLIVLAILLATITYTYSTSEKDSDSVQIPDIELSEADDEYYKLNYLDHFFNGSYTAQDVLEELLNNKTITSRITHKEK